MGRGSEVLHKAALLWNTSTSIRPPTQLAQPLLRVAISITSTLHILQTSLLPLPPTFSLFKADALRLFLGAGTGKVFLDISKDKPLCGVLSKAEGVCSTVLSISLSSASLPSLVSSGSSSSSSTNFSKTTSSQSSPSSIKSVGATSPLAMVTSEGLHRVDMSNKLASLELTFTVVSQEVPAGGKRYATLRTTPSN